MRDRRTLEIEEIRIVLERGDATSARRLAADIERSLHSTELEISGSRDRATIAIPGGADQGGLGARIVRSIRERLR